MPALLDAVEVHFAQAVLLELVLQDGQGQPGPEYGYTGKFLQEIGHGADMVLVAVRKQNAPDLVPVLSQIGEVGNHQVHAGHIVAREGQAAVNDDDVVIAFQAGDVLADLPDASQKGDIQCAFQMEPPKIIINYVNRGTTAQG